MLPGFPLRLSGGAFLLLLSLVQSSAKAVLALGDDVRADADSSWLPASFLEQEDPLDGLHPHPSFSNGTFARRLGKKRVCEPTRAGEEMNENTRTCLRQCQLNEENEVIPDFFDWEDYCYNTATDENWDPECQQFYCCLFGCEVFGGSRSPCYNVGPEDRQDLLNNVKMRQIPKGQRCDAEKCRGFCVRSEFGTCRELQYTSSCKASKLGLYKCNVQCNSTRPAQEPWRGLLLLLTLAGVAGPLSKPLFY